MWLSGQQKRPALSGEGATGTVTIADLVEEKRRKCDELGIIDTLDMVLENKPACNE